MKIIYQSLIKIFKKNIQYFSFSLSLSPSQVKNITFIFIQIGMSLRFFLLLFSLNIDDGIYYWIGGGIILFFLQRKWKFTTQTSSYSVTQIYVFINNIRSGTDVWVQCCRPSANILRINHLAPAKDCKSATDSNRRHTFMKSENGSLHRAREWQGEGGNVKGRWAIIYVTRA